MDGIEFHLEKTLWKVLDINLNSSIFSNSYNGYFNDSYLSLYGLTLSSITTQTYSGNSFSWNATSTIGIKITPTTRIQLFGNYNGLIKFAQGEDLPYYFVNVSLQQELFKKKLKINLKADDIFNTTRYSGTITEESNYYVRYDQWRKPFLLLTLAYNFNNYKSEGRKNKETEKGGF